MELMDKMMKDCGLEYSVKGDMTIRQCSTFIGLIFDALRGRLLIALEKFEKTMKLLHDMMHHLRNVRRAHGPSWARCAACRRGAS
jgi:hypothetical protein